MKTEIICITDRSGSMASIKTDAEGGFNAFLEEQKKLPGEARVTMVHFDDRIETVYQAMPLEKVERLIISPRGSTALMDAIGTTLNAQGKRIADEAWAELVIVTIITDGDENSSREFSRERIKEMVSHAEGQGWKFIFMAANQDAFSAARSYGIVQGQAMNFAASAAGTAGVYDSMSKSVTSLRTAQAPQP